MKSRNLIYLCLILCAFIDNINAKEKELDNSLQAQSMLSVLYAQSSAEYEASNIQTYVNAKSALDKALNDLNWTAAIEQKENFKNKPPAIILDIDETVLNNTKVLDLLVLQEKIECYCDELRIKREDKTSFAACRPDKILCSFQKGFTAE